MKNVKKFQTLKLIVKKVCWVVQAKKIEPAFDYPGRGMRYSGGWKGRSSPSNKIFRYETYKSHRLSISNSQ